MRARFVKSRTEEPAALHGTRPLREGKEYVVLEIFVPQGRDPLFRIEFTEGEEPAIFDSRVFEVTSSDLPPTWRFFRGDPGWFAFCPEEWSRPGFWEDYYDRVPGAVETYETEKRKILAAS